MWISNRAVPSGAARKGRGLARNNVTNRYRKGSQRVWARGSPGRRKVEIRLKKLAIRIGAAALAGCLLCVPAGCGDKGGASSATSGGSGASDVDAATYEGLKFSVNPDLNLEQRTLKVSGWNVLPEKGVNSTWDREIALLEQAEKRYNVKIERVIASSETKFVEEVTMAYTSGTVFADIIFSPSTYGLSLLKVDGLARPLDDYIDYSSDRFQRTGEFSRYLDGKAYSMLPVEAIQGNITYYNTDILEENGCTDIFELYNQGKWTWDEFNKIVKTCTKDTNGDNVVDRYGVGGSQLLDSLLASNGVPLVAVNSKEGKFECGLYSDPGKRVLDELRTLIFDYKAADDTYGSHNAISNFQNGKTAVLLAPTYYGGNFVPSGMPVKTAPLPKGPDAESSVNAAPFCEWYFAAGNSSFTTEELLQVFMEMNRNDPADPATYQDKSEEGRLEKYISEQVDTGNNFATVEEAEFLFKFINDKNTQTFLNMVPASFQGLLKDKIYLPISKGEDPRSHLESIRQVIDTALKDMGR